MGKKIIHNLFNTPVRFIVIYFIICLFMGMAHAGESASRASSDFITLYPGVYTDKEKAAMEKFHADNRAFEERGEIDIKSLINGTLPKDTPGVGPAVKVTEEMVRYNNNKYDPENQLLNVSEYAKKLGYKDILAYPTFGAHDDSFLVQFPAAARDTLLVSDLNHTVLNYKPVYPGDTLYLIVNSRHVTDLTPEEGSIYRTIGMETKGSIYNQKGEKVNDVIFRVTENAKTYKEDKKPKNPSYRDSITDWMTRPEHYYTDEDWEYIKDLWSKEKRQGEVPLYWEDVNIGDEPVWTVDGPIKESVRVTSPYGMGTGGSRTIKKEIMDPEIFKTLIKDANGIYITPNKSDYVPTVPATQSVDRPGGGSPGGPPPGGSPASGESNQGGAAAGSVQMTVGEYDKRMFEETRTETRSILINFHGRDLAIRHINNWMGDYGWLYSISWRLVGRGGLLGTDGYIIPMNPQLEHYLDKVPTLKGRYKTTQVMKGDLSSGNAYVYNENAGNCKIIHGLTGDLAIIKSYVYNKYVMDDEFFVELAWWIENIEGDIWEEGCATVKLPSKNEIH